MPSENAPVLAENTPVPAGNAPVLAENAPARTENAPASADIRTYNRNLLINYFRSGCKPPERCDALGVEVERFVLTEAGKAVGYWPRAGRPGVEQVLAGLEPYYPRASYSEGGALVGLSGSDGSISIEPSAQLELSAAPYHAVAEVGAAFRRFDQHVDALLGPSGARLVAQGYHPSRRALELPLIPKRRYHVMDAYFSHIGSHGERMMRATASTQVSIDYTSEADAVRKLRVAAALAPVLAAIMDNVTVFEARPNELPIRRLNVWRDVDPLRCGTPQGIFDDSRLALPPMPTGCLPPRPSLWSGQARLLPTSSLSGWPLTPLPPMCTPTLR